MASSGRQVSWSGSNISKIEGWAANETVRAGAADSSVAQVAVAQAKTVGAGGGDGSLVERNTD
jgi:hypothetical protein